MIDILLGHAYFLKYDIIERRVMKPYPPLGFFTFRLTSSALALTSTVSIPHFVILPTSKKS